MTLQTLPLWADALAAALLVVGAGFTLVGSIGLARLSDFFKRLHGPSKATTLGVGCVLLASAVVAALSGTATGHELLIVVFLFLTAPVSAHLLVQLALKQRPGLRPPRPSAPEAPPRAIHHAPTGADRTIPDSRGDRQARGGDDAVDRS